MTIDIRVINDTAGTNKSPEVETRRYPLDRADGGVLAHVIDTPTIAKRAEIGTRRYPSDTVNELEWDAPRKSMCFDIRTPA